VEKTLNFVDGTIMVLETSPGMDWIALHSRLSEQAGRRSCYMYVDEAEKLIAELSEFVRKKREEPTIIADAVHVPGGITRLTIDQRGNMVDLQLNDLDVELLRKVLG
jgi:hypothetical protein